MEIYAEVSAKTAKAIQDGYSLTIPDGVDAQKIGKRGYIFDCDSLSSKEEMIDILESNGIAWQDNREEQEIRNEIKLAKKEMEDENKKRKAIRDYFNQINMSGNYHL